MFAILDLNSVMSLTQMISFVSVVSSEPLTPFLLLPYWSGFGGIELRSEIVNEECWHGCLNNPSESIVPYTDTFCNVSSITGRRLVNQKVKYKVNWQQFNRRTRCSKHSLI